MSGCGCGCGSHTKGDKPVKPTPKGGNKPENTEGGNK
jgi:hypothetical protein